MVRTVSVEVVRADVSLLTLEEAELRTSLTRLEAEDWAPETLVIC